MDSPVAPEDESSLVRKARRGDASAFATLYHRHASAVHTLAYRVTGNTATAEDITQDTFLRMVQFLGGLRDGEPLRPWLKRVAANAAIDHLRRTGRLVQDDAIETRMHAMGAPSDLAEADGLLRRLGAAERTVVWLHEMEGWSHQELATRFRRSESWSKSILARALSRLRNEINPVEESDDGVDDIMQRMRRAPDVPPADALWPRLLAEQARRTRRRRAIAGVSASAMALVLMVFVARPLLVEPQETGMVAVQPQDPPADLQADVRALDQALQAAYNRGASDSEVAPMWETRRALVAKMGM